MNISSDIKKKAINLGFDACGISSIEELGKEKEFLKEWLSNNFHGDMAYMARNIDKRVNPSILVEGTNSVISVILNYFPEKNLNSESHYKISKYALGKDYHYVIKDKLKHLMDYINNIVPNVSMRAFTDSAPILDKSWAIKSGLGWMGKNTLLINKKHGSFFFIGEIIVGIDLEADSPLNKEYCGSCTKCIDACPTNALFEPYKMDATKCISYLNIETKNPIPENLKGKLNNWIYGCDICQDVCPWNSKLTPSKEEAFKISDDLALMKKQDWENLEKPQFKKLFKSSAVERGSFRRMKEIISICQENQI